MFESFISGHHSRSTPAEWLLARLTTPTRAAAIFGDLEELAATRGRLWFWTTYARILLTLTWRSPVALVCALVSMRFALQIIRRLANLMPYHLGDAGLFGEEDVRLSFILWNIPLVMAQCMAFAAPFALVRFGRRDRLTRLCGVLILVTIPVYAPITSVRDMSGIWTVFFFALAFLSPLWRRSAVVLTVTCLTAVVTMFVSTHTLVGILHRNFFTLSANTRFTCDILGVALAVLVCSRLHARLPHLRTRGTDAEPA
jgi:hypothetical protein